MGDANLREELQRLKAHLDQRLREELKQSEARLSEFQERIAKIEALAMGTVETLEDRHWKEIRALVEKERQNTGDSARAVEEIRAKLAEQQQAIAAELDELAKHRETLRRQASEQVRDQTLIEAERRRVRELEQEVAKLRAERDRDGDLIQKGRELIGELEQRVKEQSARTQGLEAQLQKRGEYSTPKDSPVQDLMSSFADQLQAIQSLSEIGKTAESTAKIREHIQSLIQLGAQFEKKAAQAAKAPVPEASAPLAASIDESVIRRILEQHAQNMEKIGEIHSKQINQLTDQIAKQKDTIRDLSEKMKSKS